MQVEVAQLARLDAGTRQGVAHRQLRTQPFRMRSGHVVCIAGFAIAAQLQRPGGRLRRLGLDQGETAGLAQ